MKQLTVIFLLFSSLSFGQKKTLTVLLGSGGYSSNNGSVVGTYNVMNYGAVGIDYVNDIEAFQLAIDACHAAGGGVVNVPRGHFGINGKVESYSNVTIRGAGNMSTFIKSLSADTMFVIHNLGPALAGVAYNDLSNTLIEDCYLEGNSLGTVGFYADRVANFMINRVNVSRFTLKGIALINSLIGSVNNCRVLSCPIGIFGFSNYSNNTATTLVTIKGAPGGSYNSSKWGVQWSGGGQLVLEDYDLSGNGTADTLSGGIRYNANQWPGGLRIYRGWAEQNLGTVVYIDGNVSNQVTNYPVYTTHSISGFQDLGHQYSFTKRSIYLKGNNQKLSIDGSSISGAINTIISDGTDNLVYVKKGTTLSATAANIVRGGAEIVIE